MNKSVEEIIKEDVQQDIIISDKNNALEYFRLMLLIRRVEDKVAALYRDKKIGCPVHLGAGQEAIAVGICDNLTKSDRVFGTHRAHAQYFAMGGDLREFFAEVLGKKTGCSRGLGGSMHLLDMKNGFYGSVPIVGATIPLATGAGLAIKRLKKSSVAVCFFGDGAAEEGVFHESLNIAASVNLPVLFVCENNLYSSHLDIKSRQPSDTISRFAKAHCIENATEDGNNVNSVATTSKKMIEYIRKTGKPGFLEYVTYRLYGHVGPNKDIDVGVRRKPEDMKFWTNFGPIRRFECALLTSGVEQSQLDKILESVELEIAQALDVAKSDPYPEPSSLMQHVYCENRGEV